MDNILTKKEIKELLTLWFKERDEDCWLNSWAIKDYFRNKDKMTAKKTNREKKFELYVKAKWDSERKYKNSFYPMKYRPKLYEQYKEIKGEKKMKKNRPSGMKYKCSKCGKRGHQARTCSPVDEDLNRNGKPFQFEEIKDVVVEYINEENVNHPKHYNSGSIEVIDAIEDWELDFNAGNVIKYIVRSCNSSHGKSNKRQDLEKAAWYINRLLNNEKIY